MIFRFNSNSFRLVSLSSLALLATVAVSSCSKAEKETATAPKPETPAPATTAAAPVTPKTETVTPAAAPAPTVPVSTGGAALASVDQRVSYGVGYNVATIIMKQGADLKVDGAALEAGIADAVAHQKTRVSGQELQAAFEVVTKRAADKQKAETDAFFEKNRARPGVTVTTSGLQYEVVAHGKGEVKPKATDTVVVTYRGTLLDGTVFDDSEMHGGPATFGVRAVIPGWTEALQLMSVGDKFRLYIPSGLAYGSRGSGNIPPNAPLIFDVELIAIK